jgi:two-component system response regulator AtoC
MKAILVVDDEEVLRSLYAEALSEAGYLVFKAASGEDALMKIKKVNFHLIVTDLNMPGISGLDLLKNVKETKPDTQVILLTSHMDLQLAGNATKLGLFWYLVKPLDDLNDLVNKVGEAIGPA